MTMLKVTCYNERKDKLEFKGEKNEISFTYRSIKYGRSWIFA